MGEEEFPPNSRAKKAPPPRPEQKKVERVTEGPVIRRKKPMRRKILEALGGNDARGVWGYVWLDVLLPAARDMIADAGREGIERMIYRGEPRPRSRHGRGEPSGHVPYNRYSSSYGRRDEPRREMSRRGRALHDFDEIILDTRAEADEVLDRLDDWVERYDLATVADLYEMCNISGNFTDQKWGWTDLSGARVTRVRNGYLLDLPRPEPLD